MEKFFQRFENVKTFEAYLANTPTAATYKNWQASQDSNKRSANFTKTASYAAANKMLLFGDTKTAQSIKAAGYDAAVKAVRYENRRTYASNVVGAAVNVPNYLAGVPCNMIRCTTVRQPKNVLTIGYNMSVAENVSAAAIQENAAKLLAAVVTLEAKGVRCNLYALNHSYNFGDTITALLAIKIKNASQPLDLLKCAYPLAHPSMNRRHKFRWLEVTGAFDGEYGYCETNTGKSIKLFREHGLHFDQIYTFYDLQRLSPEKIVENLIKGQI